MCARCVQSNAAMIDSVALRISAVFNRCFAISHRTIMRGGGDEPLYLPPTKSQCAEIVFNRDYPASALHEAAHWCVASHSRRQSIDYGYFYEPPPRSVEAQARFLEVEANNQGLEMVLSVAARLCFAPSTDDLTATPAARRRFADAVAASAACWRARGLPFRARRFARALAQEFDRGR